MTQDKTTQMEQNRDLRRSVLIINFENQSLKSTVLSKWKVNFTFADFSQHIIDFTVTNGKMLLFYYCGVMSVQGNTILFL